MITNKQFIYIVNINKLTYQSHNRNLHLVINFRTISYLTPFRKIRITDHTILTNNHITAYYTIMYLTTIYL